jgi:hypothetical protein
MVLSLEIGGMMLYLGSGFILGGEAMDSPNLGEHGSIPEREANGEDPLTEGTHHTKHSCRHKLAINADEKHGRETQNVPDEHQRICHGM